jgi:hypothetical protein
VLKRTRQKDIAFIEDFYKKAEDYLFTFLKADEAHETRKDRYSHKGLPEAQMEELIASVFSQREALSKIIDRATQLSIKHQVSQEYWRLLEMKIGGVSEWGHKLTFTDDFAVALKDSVVRTVAASERLPSFGDDILAAPGLAWQWLDKRGVAKWIVIGVLVIVLFTILKAIGYDLHGLIELVKAIRGEK